MDAKRFNAGLLSKRFFLLIDEGCRDETRLAAASCDHLPSRQHVIISIMKVLGILGTHIGSVLRSLVEPSGRFFACHMRVRARRPGHGWRA
jgi:hypothetical protein